MSNRGPFDWPWDSPSDKGSHQTPVAGGSDSPDKGYTTVDASFYSKYHEFSSPEGASPIAVTVDFNRSWAPTPFTFSRASSVFVPDMNGESRLVGVDEPGYYGAQYNSYTGKLRPIRAGNGLHIHGGVTPTLVATDLLDAGFKKMDKHFAIGLIVKFLDGFSSHIVTGDQLLLLYNSLNPAKYLSLTSESGGLKVTLSDGVLTDVTEVIPVDGAQIQTLITIRAVAGELFFYCEGVSAAPVAITVQNVLDLNMVRLGTDGTASLGEYWAQFITVNNSFAENEIPDEVNNAAK